MEDLYAASGAATTLFMAEDFAFCCFMTELVFFAGACLAVEEAFFASFFITDETFIADPFFPFVDDVFIAAAFFPFMADDPFMAPFAFFDPEDPFITFIAPAIFACEVCDV